MSQSNSSTEHFGWKVYKVSPPDMQEAFLKELDLSANLPLVTWEGQVGMLDGAPDDVILMYLEQVYWKGQIVLFEKHLSVSAHFRAIPLLHPLAKRHLKLPAPKTKVRRWDYKLP